RLGKQLFAKAAQRRRLVHVIPRGQQLDSQVDLSGALDGLPQDARRAPVNIFKQAAMRVFESDQVISPVIRRAQRRAIAGALERRYSRAEQWAGQGRAVGINQAERTVTDGQQVLRRVKKPVTKACAALGKQAETLRQQTIIGRL